MTATVPDVIQRTLVLQAHQKTTARQRLPVSQPAPIQFLLFEANPDQRSAPNEIFRCSLFSARNKNQKRENLKKELISIIGRGTIVYTGERLNQDDATVWLQALYLSKELSPGNAVEFRPYSFCKSVGWAICGSSYKRLDSSLLRLRSALLVVDSERLSKCETLNLLTHCDWTYNPIDKAPTGYQIRIDPSLVELFKGDHFTTVQWKQRLDLPDGLAKWLHSYFAGHKKPYPIKLETIKEGAGLTAQIKHIKKMVKDALVELVRVGFLSSYSESDLVEKDLVRVVRKSNLRRNECASIRHILDIPPAMEEFAKTHGAQKDQYKKQNPRPCPKCNGSMRLRKNRETKASFWSCENTCCRGTRSIEPGWFYIGSVPIELEEFVCKPPTKYVPAEN